MICTNRITDSTNDLKKETGFDENTWTKFQTDFISSSDKGELIELDSAHYVHSIDYKRIAEEAEEFIESLNQNKTSLK